MHEKQDVENAEFAEIEAVAFDYGNTLIEFGPTQIQLCDKALGKALQERFGTLDFQHLKQIRDANRKAVFAGDPPAYRENDLREISRKMVHTLFRIEPDTTMIDELVNTRGEIFLSQVEAPPFLHRVLDALCKKKRLALLSNYPSGSDIRNSLNKIDIAQYFESVVVSGDVGYVKPHPLPFQVMLDQLSLSPHRVVYIGDNWLADIQGAKKMGMKAIWTQQFESVEQSSMQMDDHMPDGVISHLEMLLNIFDAE